MLLGTALCLCLALLLGWAYLGWNRPASPGGLWAASWLALYGGAVLGSAEPLLAGIGAITHLTGALFAGLVLAGTIVLSGAALPRWLLPLTFGWGIARLALVALGLEAWSHATSIPLEGAAEIAAVAIAWTRRRPSLRPAPETLLAPALLLVAAMDGAYSAMALSGRGPLVGHLVWALVSLLAIPIQFAVVFGRQRDRKAELRREVEIHAGRLSAEHQTLLAVLAAAPAGILLVDREKRVSLLNQTAVRHFGLADPDEWKGRPGDGVLREWASGLAKPEVLEQALAAIERGAGLTVEGLEVETHGPGTRQLELYSAPVLSESGDPLGRIWVSRDVTDQKDLERQLLQTQKLESLGVLAGGLAHDFNNLLMGILGSAELALESLPSSSSEREHLALIQEAGRTAADLCRQMLAYSGRASFALEEIDLSRVVSEIAQLIRSSISKKATLELRLAEGLPAIEADPAQIRRVAINLVTNASEALGEERGVIRIATGVARGDLTGSDPLWLPGRPLRGPAVFLEVADTGCGMNEETRAKIFDPFFSTRFTGRGLGLAGVLGIVRGHQGAVRVESEPGRGTRFTVLFPALDSRAESTRPEGGAEEEWRGSGTVLLVDDERTVRRVARRMLERTGFTVLTAADGREAVELFRAWRREILFVLLDLTMPGMDGEETLRELRRIDERVRVILASGYAEEEVARRFAGGEPAAIVHKPFRLDELRGRIARVLRD